jgi:predicted transglutaminase-like cysteine proteinase
VHVCRGRLLVQLLVLTLAFMMGAVVAGETLLSERSTRQFAKRYGDSVKQRLDAWEELMRAHHDSPEKEKLQQVNAFFNQLPWLSDEKHWGLRDYWAMPLEMVGTDGGDCEDYSVDKFITLVHMGIDPKRLRITYVRAVSLKQPHMVIAHYAKPGAQPLILDNLIQQIKPGGQRPDLVLVPVPVPVYSFNTAELWASKPDGETRRVGAAARLTAWRDVSWRLREEGLDVGTMKRAK